MEHAEPIVKHRRRCPICKSEELTRLTRTWQERVIGWFVGAHKYRCFICGHEFMSRANTSTGRKAKAT